MNKEDLECPLCQDIYREPKTLECLHSYCLDCLELLHHQTSVLLKPSCPLCATPINLKLEQLRTLSTDLYLLQALEEFNSVKVREDLKQLNGDEVKNEWKFIEDEEEEEKRMCICKENEAISYCIECQVYFCGNCTKNHQLLKITQKHSIVLMEELENQETLVVRNQAVYCRIHPQKEVDLYCQSITCQVPICSLCFDEHKSHSISSLTSVIENEKQIMTERIDEAKAIKVELELGLQRYEKALKDLEINATLVQTQISQFFTELKNELIKKEEEILKGLERTERSKKKQLLIQKKDLEFGIEGINNSCKVIENSISQPNSARLLLMRKQYLSRLQSLNDSKYETHPDQLSHIAFKVSQKNLSLFQSSLPSIGILESNEISPEKCLILGVQETEMKVYENEEYSFGILCYSKEGNQIENGGNQENFHVQIEGIGETESEVIDLKDGKYKICIKFKSKGKYNISVSYDGIVIPSPFQIQVFHKPIQRNYSEIKRAEFFIGSSGEGNGQFNYPYYLCINSKGFIFATEFSNHRVQIFDSKGTFISKFGSLGSGDGQFNGPMGIAIGLDDRIFVCDSNNHRIQAFDQNGKFIGKFGIKGIANGQLSNPFGIVIDQDGRILICDNGNHRIQVFNSRAKFLFSIGQNGTGEGQFNGPRGITLNSKGDILVSDYGNKRIQVFDMNGKFLKSFGVLAQLDQPWGIITDFQDNILVCDRKNNLIQVFNENGDHLTKFAINEAKGPTGIAIDSITQKIIVSENVNHRLSVF